MKNLLLIVYTCSFAFAGVAVTDTMIIKTSFDGADSALYTLGSIHGKGQWAVAAGTGEITSDVGYVQNGTRGLKLSTTAALLDVRHTPFAGNVPGVSGIVYFDLYVKINSLQTKEFTIVGHDLYGGSTKRTFVVEFSVPSGDSGEVRVYAGSSRPKYLSYKPGVWYRVSGKVNYTTATYQISVNAFAPVTASFRETYTPTASGTRQAGIKEYHQLYICLGGGTSSGAVGTVDAGIDSLYVGTVPPVGVDFGSVIQNYTVAVTQPSVGTIAVSPSGTSFPESTFVTVALSLPAGYKNYGWTGDLSGTDTVKQFYITKNMTFSANVGIDSTNPPPQYTISVQQPDTGSITISPVSVQYYAYTKVTATLTLPAGYKNIGWTGDLSGTELSRSFSIVKNMTIGANVIKDTVISSGGQKKIFTTAAAFKTGISNAVPGDTIELVNGKFDIGSITIITNASEQSPILIRAQNRGKTELTGNSRFTVRWSSFIILEGFLFTSSGGTVIKGENSNNIRITRNIFRLNESSSGKWIIIGGIYNSGELNTFRNRIDHNLFEEKHQLGNYITIDGTPEDYPPAKSSQYDRIDHNHFRFMGPRAVNEMEAVRIGQSSISATSGFTLVEFNLFEECDGDPEIVSVKTNDNVIRYNTFLRSQGTASLRQGNNTTLYGNYFLGRGKEGTGGVRVYGTGHTIYNNYFEGLTGDTWDAALAITNGDVDTNSTSMSSHHRPNRITVAFNTFVNNANNLQFGFTNNGNYSKPPVNITIANNLVVGSQNELVKYFTQPTSIAYSGNIMFPQGSATLGITATESQIKIIDPQLVFADSVWRLSAGSPAINTAAGTYDVVQSDIEGQLRDALKDVGADEYSFAPSCNRPLTPSDVGPDGPDSISVVTSVNISRVKNAVPSEFVLHQNYPNPFNPETKIGFNLHVAGYTSLKIYDMQGKEVATLVKQDLPAGEYTVRWNAVPFSSGIYYYTLKSGSFVQIKKMMLLK